MKITIKSPTAASALTGLALVSALMAASPSWAQSTLLANSDFSIASREQSTREPAGLRTAAAQGLQHMLKELGQGIAPGTLPEGFPFEVADFSELKNATLGLGFEVHSVAPQRLMSGGLPLDQMLQGNGIWQFLVMVGQHPVAMLEMAKQNGKWQVQGAGGAKLAQDVYQAAQTHGGKSAFRFVRIYQATSDLLEVRDAQAKAKYVPLIAARESLKMLSPASKDTALPGAQDVLPLLQEAVRKNMDNQTTR